MRSIIAWLRKQKVEIHGEKSGKRKFVFKINFERRLLEYKISFLRDKHGKDWLQAFQSEMKIHAQYQAILEGKQLAQKPNATSKQNKTLGSHATKFLEDIHRGHC